MAVHFAKRNTKFGGGGKRGRAKIPGEDDTQTPFLFALPSVQFRFCHAKRGNGSISFKEGLHIFKQRAQIKNIPQTGDIFYYAAIPIFCLDFFLDTSLM